MRISDWSSDVCSSDLRFGKGHPAGLAGPESANNAAAQTSFIPLLTLGIPGNAVTALMIGAMTIHNIQPGPQVMTSHPELFWGLHVSMWIGNLMLIVLHLPLVGLLWKLLKEIGRAHDCTPVPNEHIV